MLAVHYSLEDAGDIIGSVDVAREEVGEGKALEGGGGVEAGGSEVAGVEDGVFGGQKLAAGAFAVEDADASTGGLPGGQLVF